MEIRSVHEWMKTHQTMHKLLLQETVRQQMTAMISCSSVLLVAYYNCRTVQELKGREHKCAEFGRNVDCGTFRWQLFLCPGSGSAGDLGGW